MNVWKLRIFSLLRLRYDLETNWSTLSKRKVSFVFKYYLNIILLLLNKYLFKFGSIMKFCIISQMLKEIWFFWRILTDNAIEWQNSRKKHICQALRQLSNNYSFFFQPKKINVFLFVWNSTIFLCFYIPQHRTILFESCTKNWPGVNR